MTPESPEVSAMRPSSSKAMVVTRSSGMVALERLVDAL